MSMLVAGGTMASVGGEISTESTRETKHKCRRRGDTPVWSELPGEQGWKEKEQSDFWMGVLRREPLGVGRVI